MSVEVALADLLKAGHKVEFTHAGGIGVITEKEGGKSGFYSFSGFVTSANKIKAAAVAVENRKKYVSGMRVIVNRDAPREYAGREGKIEAYDAGDNTVYIRFTTKTAPSFQSSTAWVSVEKVRLLPFAIKDMVEVVSVEDDDNDHLVGEKGIIVTDDSADANDSQPYLVYLYGEDDTFWCSAAELKLYEG